MQYCKIFFNQIEVRAKKRRKRDKNEQKKKRHKRDETQKM